MADRAAPHPDRPLSPRESVLVAAREAMIGGSWQTDSLAALAGRAQVSRQTIYNDFGSRDGLAVAVAQATAADFLEGTRAAVRRVDDPLAQVIAGMSWALAAAHDDLLIKAVLTGDDAALLPFLTTRSGDVIVPITQAIAAEIDHPSATWACEVAMRMLVSQLLLPLTADEDYVAAVAELIAPLFRPAE